MRVICSSPSFKMSKKEERKSDFFFFQKTSDSQEKPKCEFLTLVFGLVLSLVTSKNVFASFPRLSQCRREFAHNAQPYH